MKMLTGIVLAALALPLAACGDKEGGTSAAAPVAAVPPPAGTVWADTVAATPEGGFVMGNPKAAVRLTEFASYTCSHCADFSATSSEELRELVNTGKISFELRNFIRDPLDMTTTLLARCGGKDPFFALSEQFFGNQAAMFERAQGMGDEAYKAAMSAPPEQRFINLADATGLLQFAKERGIPEQQAKQCLANGKEAEALAKRVQEATTQYNIQGTPALLLNGSVVENVTTWEALKPKLKEAGV
jgi:protein-disulfide isomerase